jgi:predicted transcriptional regulator
MEKALLDVIYISERRMNVLLMLQDGPREMESILESLYTTRTALLPQIKILKQHHLIYQSGDAYGLTNTGKLIANKMTPFLNTIEILEKNSNYLATHKLDCIPEHLLVRIHEINGCEIIEPSIVNTHEINAECLKEALVSKAVYSIFTFMHPLFPSILREFVRRGVDLYIILTSDLIQKLKSECFEVFEDSLSCENVRIYMYQNNIKISSLAVADNGFLLRLPFNNNEYSNKQLLCCNSKGRQWGKDFYDYYLKDSIQITEI